MNLLKNYEIKNTFEGIFVSSHKNNVCEFEIFSPFVYKMYSKGLFGPAIDLNSAIEFAKLFKPDHSLKLCEFYKRHEKIADYLENLIIFS